MACILNSINGVTTDILKKHYLHRSLKRNGVKIEAEIYLKPANEGSQDFTIFESLLLLYMYYVVMPDDNENEGKYIFVKIFQITFFYKT